MPCRCDCFVDPQDADSHGGARSRIIHDHGQARGSWIAGGCIGAQAAAFFSASFSASVGCVFCPIILFVLNFNFFVFCKVINELKNVSLLNNSYAYDKVGMNFKYITNTIFVLPMLLNIYFYYVFIKNNEIFGFVSILFGLIVFFNSSKSCYYFILFRFIDKVV